MSAQDFLQKRDKPMTTQEILDRAVAARSELILLTEEKKNAGLFAMADALEASTEDILSANALDMERAKSTLTEVMLDRLYLDAGRVHAMAEGVRAVAALPDPVGKILASHTRADGLLIEKITVPVGVVAIIYESRPNVTSDAAALAFKSGNVCVLRAGKEAHATAAAIVRALRAGLLSAGLSADLVALIEDVTRESANELMHAVGKVDLLIPRGGKGLIRACTENATVPCIETGTGICHIYVDRDADLDRALAIVENAKTSRPSVCNAAEVCLVDESIAPVFLPRLKARLCDDRITAGKKPVELRLDEAAGKYITGKAAGDEDFDTEFLDYILAVGIVDGVDAATAHIARHSTHHSEAIVTENAATAARFTAAVDSAAVYVNASTRFTDGGEFGLGCEMGISTQKLHARGPMGLSELCTYKYVIRGEGHVR